MPVPQSLSLKEDRVAELTPDVVRSAMTYVNSWLAYRQAQLRIPGVQAAVLFDGDLVLSSAHGHADVENNVALTAQHLFRVASHSKTFTATAILQLVEAGGLRLDDTVGRWLAWLESPLADVTLRELLSHSGGVIRDSGDSDFWQLQRPFPDEDGLRQMALRGASVLPPNERFKYSNIGFSLLGLVIEAASGRRYNDYVTAEVVQRLGLEHTGPELDASRATEYAAGYSSLAYAPVRVPIDHVDTGAMSAATGFYSTAEDLCRYFSAHFWGDTRLVSDASKRVLQHQWWEVERTPNSGYGLGFSIAKAGERRLAGHGGGYPGHITRSVFDPDARLAVSVLTNAMDGPADELAVGVVKLLDLAADKQSLPHAGQDRFCGRFANLMGVFDVASLGGRLLLLRPVGPDPTDGYAELKVESDTLLRVEAGPGYGAVGEPIAYAFTPDGNVSSVKGPAGLTAWPLDTYRVPGPRVSLPEQG
jgi:CubicO group peptidase (beta-lactamase class C family)